MSEDEDDDCIPRGGGADGGEADLLPTGVDLLASEAASPATAQSLPPARRSSREVRPNPRRSPSPTPSPSTSRAKAASVPPLRAVAAPLRVAPEDPETCKLSDDLADSCKTLCKVCGQPFFLTGMRSHTQAAHGLQITMYKEIHGPFEIIEKVFHKCHICGKILLLDSDAMGGHIKGTHKMKERDYKEKYCTYAKPSTNLKFSTSQKYNVSQKSLKAGKSSKSLPPVKALKASKSLKSVKSNKSLKSRKSKIEEDESDEDQEWLKRKARKVRTFDPFKDVEYDCAMPHCDPCGRSSVVVQLASLDKQELEKAEEEQHKMEPNEEEVEKQQDSMEPNEEEATKEEMPLCTKSMPRLIRSCLAAEVLEPAFSSTDSEEGSMDVSGESSMDIDTSTDMGDSEEDEEKVVDEARKKMECEEEAGMEEKASVVDGEEKVEDYEVNETKDNVEEVELEENCCEVEDSADGSGDFKSKWRKEHGDHDEKLTRGDYHEEELMNHADNEKSYIGIMDEIFVNVKTSE